VAYRLVDQGGVMVIAEIRILPANPTRRGTLGEWSLDAAAVPPGGVTDAVIKALRTELPIERARDVFAYLTSGLDHEHVATAASLACVRPLGQGRNGTRPRRRNPLPLLELGAAYARLVKDRHPAPVKAAAAECHYSPRYASKRIADARECGYLTPTSRGRAGGQLTDEARDLLQRAGAA
jgi:hypothetical protein